MPSPFPGVDPYVESSGRWGDFHDSMIAAMRASLNERLPAGYAAEINLYVWFHEPDARERRARVVPDVHVTREPASPRLVKSRPGGALLPAPRRLVFPAVERRRHRYVRIVDVDTNRVVTVIELLSPANKASGDDREAFLAKRAECLAQGLNLVEIDLLRGGRRLPLGKPVPKDAGSFYALVCRAWEYPQVDFWSFGLRDPLPDVPVPLGRDVPDVLLPLRPCADRAYDEGKYRQRLPYRRPLVPRPDKRDIPWIRNLLAGESNGRGQP
jgi:hypothetical protein